MPAIGLIPARYASTRFPGKPLAIINGKTIAVKNISESTSPLRIKGASGEYGINLVEITDPKASNIRIQTSSGIKALEEFS